MAVAVGDRVEFNVGTVKVSGIVARIEDGKVFVRTAHQMFSVDSEAVEKIDLTPAPSGPGGDVSVPAVPTGLEAARDAVYAIRDALAVPPPE